MPTYLAVGAAGVAGYYLYSAGGSPKEAVRKAEGGCRLSLPPAVGNLALIDTKGNSGCAHQDR